MKHGNIIVFYDGDSSLWRRRVQLLRRLDRKDCVHFANIKSRSFDARVFDKTQNELSAVTHCLLADGTWIKGTDVLRHVYSLVGFGFVARLTELPLLRPASEICYRLFCRLRLQDPAI